MIKRIWRDEDNTYIPHEIIEKMCKSDWCDGNEDEYLVATAFLWPSFFGSTSNIAKQVSDIKEFDVFTCNRCILSLLDRKVLVRIESEITFNCNVEEWNNG